MGNQVNSQPPRGPDGQAIQVLRPDEVSVQQVTIGATQQRITLPSETDVVEITVTADCRIKFGNGTVVADANSRALLRGTYVYSTEPPSWTHISVIRLTAADSGNATVARML